MEKSKEFKVVRVYPHGWTNTGMDELNKLLKDGWQVKKVVACNKTTKGDIINDYILFRYTQTKPIN